MNEKNKKPSIVEEAIGDYKKIVEAAEVNAQKKLANEFPKKFAEFVNEELKGDKKEPYKKINENINDSTDEESEENKIEEKLNDMKKPNKETLKNDVVGKKTKSDEKKVEEDVKIIDTVGDDDPFTEKVKPVDETVKITDTVGKSDPFTKKGKKEKSIDEAFDLSELDLGDELEDDEITFDSIENEIAELEGLEEELEGMGGLPRPKSNFGNPKGQTGDIFNKLMTMKNQIDEMINQFGDESENEVNDPQSDEYSDINLDEIEGITDTDIDAVLEPDNEVEEAYGVSFTANKGVTASNPRAEYASSPAAVERRREFTMENKKMNSLIKEHKNLTKKFNENVKKYKAISTLVESYKTALGKYRNQLKEMAIFNTNLAHVNNLFVNESIILTQKDKIRIINDFKKVNSIVESQEKYKSLLTQMSTNKKTISETVENKVNASIQPSSKKKLDEVIEKTAYEKDPHLDKIKRIVEYVENRGKK